MHLADATDEPPIRRMTVAAASIDCADWKPHLGAMQHAAVLAAKQAHLVHTHIHQAQLSHAELEATELAPGQLRLTMTVQAHARRPLTTTAHAGLGAAIAHLLGHANASVTEQATVQNVPEA